MAESRLPGTLTLERPRRHLGSGLELVVGDHRLQTRLLDSLAGAIRRGRAADLGRGLLLDIVQHTRAHFQAETILMRRHGYPRVSEHVREHEAFLRRLTELKTAHAAAERPITAETVGTLRKWFGRHIQEMDADMESYLRALDALDAPTSRKP